jgi:hypothetical protein
MTAPPQDTIIIADFMKGVGAFIIDSSPQQCFMTTQLNSTGFTPPDDCYNTPAAPVVTTVNLGGLTASVVEQTVSNPGHFTLSITTTVNLAACATSLISHEVTVLNGNGVPNQVLAQSFWNIQEGISNPNVFNIPDNCQMVPPEELMAHIVRAVARK